MRTKTSTAVGLILVIMMASAFADNKDIRNEGARDGKQYALDLMRNGIKVDGTACADGMATEDNSRPQYTQEQIETYAKAFGNACMGRKVFQ